MDAFRQCLKWAHAAFVVGMNAPREHVAPALRAEVERATDGAERVFTGLRDAVRRSAGDGGNAERHINATLDRLEKQNAAILDRLPARK